MVFIFYKQVNGNQQKEIEGSGAVMSWLPLGVSCLMAVVLCLRFMLGGGCFDILYSMRLDAFLFSSVRFI
jgi:hypothetical protein